MNPWEIANQFIPDPFICPECGSEDCVPPTGDENSLVLFIGEFPGQDEINKGRPFTGRTGTILKVELIRYGYQFGAYRIMNLWKHAPNKNSKCFELGIKQCIEESKHKKLIVLIGSETVKYFTGLKVSEWNGLLVQSPLLNCEKILAVIQPTTVFHGSIGEMKFGIKRLVHYLGELENDE